MQNNAPWYDAVRHLPSLDATGQYLDMQALHCLRSDLDIQLLEAGAILGQLLVIQRHVHHEARARLGSCSGTASKQQ
jgi:hypothetical protein